MLQVVVIQGGLRLINVSLVAGAETEVISENMRRAAATSRAHFQAFGLTVLDPGRSSTWSIGTRTTWLQPGRWPMSKHGLEDMQSS